MSKAIWKQPDHLLKSNQLVLSQNIMSDAREKIILIKQLVDTWTMDALIKNEITDEERLDQLLALIVLKKQKDYTRYDAVSRQIRLTNHLDFFDHAVLRGFLIFSFLAFILCRTFFFFFFRCCSAYSDFFSMFFREGMYIQIAYSILTFCE